MKSPNKFSASGRSPCILHHKTLRYRYLYLHQQAGVFVFVCQQQQQQHMTILEKSVETDVMPSLCTYSGIVVVHFTFQDNNHQRDFKTVGLKIKFPSCFMADYRREVA